MTSRLIARPRLVELLNQRWERRVVLVTAGPGFGKSSALAEAVAENALAPRGTDVLVECSLDEHTAGALTDRIAAAAGIALPAVDPTQPMRWLLDELARRSPLGGCVLLDDAHLVDQGIFRQLVSWAPASLHLVLATRSKVGGLAKLRACGELLEIGEDDLRLSSTEVAQLAAAYGVDPGVLDG